MIVHVNTPSVSKTFRKMEEVIYIVVDTFSATTSLVTLKEAGVKRIYVVQNGAEAKEMHKSLIPPGLLIGEKDGLKIEGFDYGNTPSLFYNLFLENKEVIFTSTSGAKTITALSPSIDIYIGSIVNMTKISNIVSDHAYFEQKDVCIVPAGYSLNEDEYVLEDWVTSVLIAKKISNKLEIEIESKSEFLQQTQKILKKNKNLESLLSTSPNALYLDKLGFKKDVDFAVSVDKIDNFLKVNEWLKINEIKCVVLE